MKKECKHIVDNWVRVGKEVCTYRGICKKCGAEFISANKIKDK